MAAVLTEPGCDVTIVGRKWGSKCLDEEIPFRIIRFRMIFNKGFIFYKFFNIRLFIHLLFGKYDLVIANDLDTLLPNYLVSRIKGTTLVYDSHEYFTGVPELTGRPFVRWIWKSIERLIFPELRNVITVSDSITDLYEKEYRISPAVIRNFAPSSAGIQPFTKQDLGFAESDLLLILQGNGINIDKGAEELIGAVSRTENVSLIIAGSGDVVAAMKLKVADLNISHRIKFLSAMPWNQLMRYTKTADVGMVLEKDTCINYRFSLPNKLFDYISAGIPVITGNLPEIRKIIETAGCGLSIPEISSSEIIAAIRKLQNDQSLLNILTRKAVEASDIYNWEKESLKVKEFYLRILETVKN
jgi:glycosyltransferase involved in cell wall biosynthesis